MIFFNKHIYFSHKEHFRMIFKRLLFQLLIHFIQTMNIKALNLSEIVGKWDILVNLVSIK